MAHEESVAAFHAGAAHREMEAASGGGAAGLGDRATPWRGGATVAPGETASEAAPRWSWLASFGIRPFLLGSDLLAVAISVAGGEVISARVGVAFPAHKAAAFGILLLLALWQAGLYRSRLSLSVLDDLPVLAGRWLIAAGLAVLGQVVWSRAVWRDYIVQWRFLWGAVVIGLLLALFRAGGYATARRLRRRGLVIHRALILGAGRVGRQVAEILRTHPEYGLWPIGFLDTDPGLGDTSTPLLLGPPDRLTVLLEEQDINSVVVAFSAMKESEMVSVIRACDRSRCELFVVPRLFELLHVNDEMDNAWGLPLVRLRRSTYRSQSWRLKRLFDIVVSGVLLLFLAPAFLAVAAAVRLDGGPGVLFRQERVGVDGRHFQLLKFRSLRPASAQESATTWNVAHDSRLSRVGRFLRRTSLDELPQLVNVLRGDMSLVGPRPERPHFVHQFQSAYPSYAARHRVPSGLTGWAQVHGLRGDTSIADRARFDNYYIENWSLWLDLKIVLRTLVAVLRGAGA